MAPQAGPADLHGLQGRFVVQWEVVARASAESSEDTLPQPHVSEAPGRPTHGLGGGDVLPSPPAAPAPRCNEGTLSLARSLPETPESFEIL